MMEIKEAIERYTSNAEYERSHGNLQGCLEFKQLAEWLKELEQLREQTKWIPVSERLPEKAGQYLVTIQSPFGVNSIEIANFSLDLSIVSCLFSNKKGKSGWWGCDDNGWNIFIYSSVIAWMPLPAPYKAESEKVKEHET